MADGLVGTTVSELLDAVRSGTATSTTWSVPTGFTPLDRAIGGLRSGSLILVGGGPGVGKTTAMLQWARSVAAQGETALVVCYEHDEHELLLRLAAQVAPEVGMRASSGIDDELLTHPQIDRALAQYGDRIILKRASGGYTDLSAITDLVNSYERPVLFLDYLQKVPVIPPPVEEQRVTLVAQGLKELALAREIPVVSAVAVGDLGLAQPRHRLPHIRGASGLSFEADVVLMLNRKADIVAREHIAFDPRKLAGFAPWVIFSVEKNRAGQTGFEIEFKYDRDGLRFNPQGGMVEERLIGDRLHPDEK